MKIRNLFTATLVLLLLVNSISAGDYLAPSTTNPGGFAASEVPQLIVIGSDDNSSATAMRWMTGELGSRTNKDGTPLRMSYYSNTTYWQGNQELVEAHKEAYAAKHEVANHTVDHPYCIEHEIPWKPTSPITKWWTTNELVTQQMQPVMDALVSQVGVSADDIYGFRTPFLGFSDNTFEAMYEIGIVYDCSIGEGGGKGNYNWPYTLDSYPPGLPNWWTSQALHNVTLSTYPGLWELPAYNFIGPSGQVIGGLDYNMWAATNSGGHALNKQQSISTLKNTLDAMYNGNRTPFTVGVHSQMYFGTETDFPNITQASDRQAVFTEFLDYAVGFENVWFVTGAQAINYCRRPVKISEFDPDDYLPENFNNNGTTYVLTVENGNGDGNYVEGAVKPIVADAPPSGKVFDKWTGDVATVADVNASTTTVTMGTSAITVTATYKDDTGPDTTDASVNFTTFDASSDAWQIGSIDELGSTGDVSKTSDDVVKGDFTFAPYDESKGDNGYAYGSIAYYDDIDHFTDVNYIKVTYKSTAELNIVLEQSTFPSGGAHQKKISKSDNFTTILLEVNSTNFTQPSWADPKSDLDMAKMNGIAFEPVVPNAGATISFEISELVFYGYDDGTPVSFSDHIHSNKLSINNISAKTMNLSVPQSGKYSLEVYSLDGKLVAKIAEKNLSAGNLNVVWNGEMLSSKMYLFALKGAGFQSVRKAFISK